ncbi:CHAT domain-containing protein [Streptomyces sp. NPDC048278]|uniref:CHAT domain-containing protein n=1 Tax=Streptomyces sp. NPDC048278 TaxID=3155809 RepID=UPI0034338C60
MTAQDAMVELAALWPRLPLLVGRDWPKVRSSALELVGRLADAGDDDERIACAERLLILLAPYSGVRDLLSPAFLAGRRSTEDGVDLAAVCRLLASAPWERWIDARLDAPTSDNLSHTRTLHLQVDRLAHPFAFSSAWPGATASDAAETAWLHVDVYAEAAHVSIRPVRQRLPVFSEVPDLARDLPGASFDITFLRADQPTVVLARVNGPDGLLFQLLPLTLHPDGPVEQCTLLPRGTGRAAARPADLRITLVSEGEVHRMLVDDRSGYNPVVVLPHRSKELEILARRARASFETLLTGSDGRVYEKHLEIPEPVYRTGLRAVARSGTDLFRGLFRPNGGSAALRELGDMLIRTVDEAQAGALPRVEIVSSELSLPWHLMYVTDYCLDAELSPTRLLGLACEVDVVTARPGCRFRGEPGSGADGARGEAATTAPGSRSPALVAVNTDIDRPDTARARTLVADQTAYWRQGLATRAEVVDDRDRVAAALAGEDPYALWYFYCHLEQGEEDDPDDVSLVFTGGRHVSLRDLMHDVPADTPLRGSPLVVLNVCMSTMPDTLGRAGFPPYFVSRGARGVVCTETDVPAEFGAQWARRFFDRLLAGHTMRGALHDTRRELVCEHRNLLGLVYTAMGQGDATLEVPR